MEIDLELLTIQNPWWSGDHFKYDPVLETFEDSTLKWQPAILDQIKLNKDQAILVQGPRGVGKTTAMKLLIRKLIREKNIIPENIFYYSCHNLGTYEQLNELIKTFVIWRREGKVSGEKNKKRLYIFIDEITLVKKWEQGIEYLKKAKLLDAATLFLSGSLLSDVSLKNTDKTGCLMSSLPLGEFINLLNPALMKSLGEDGRNYEKHKGNLDYYLDIYFLTGGFISAINDFKERGAVKQAVYSNYLYWLMADLAKLGRDIVTFRQMLEQILSHLGQAVGYQTLAQKTKAKTHLTAAEYVDILEAMFAIKAVYQRDQSGRPSRSKAKKIYFRDPFLFWIFYSHIHGSLNYWQFSRERLHREEVFNALVENVVFSHLIKTENLTDWDRRVTYWRDNIRKKEIDFVVQAGDRAVPMLIRYNREIAKQDMDIFSLAGFKKGIIISHDRLDLEGDIKIMPLAYFLLYYRKFI